MADSVYPVSIHVLPAIENRNRVTTFFRFFLAIPHLLLVGGPGACALWFGAQTDHHGLAWGSGPGLIGAVAALITVFAWFVILFTGSHPEGLRRISEFYLRWRVRAVAYLMLLRDDYPPFGDAPYPAELVLGEPPTERNRVTVFFRLVLAIPHAIALTFLSLVWALTTTVAWLLILFTGTYPETLYGFGLGVLAWSIRVEAYVLLLSDEYPPFSLRV